MWNFRNKQFPHTVRVWAEREVKPILASRYELDAAIDTEAQVQQRRYDELMRQQTEGRHFQSYYDKLANTLLCCCFGGWFLLPIPQEEAGAICLWGRKLLRKTGWKTMAIAQWDSWRMWEAFAAGAVVIHVNFDQHGFKLPGPTPEAMKHYIPVDLQKPEKNLSSIMEDTAALRNIAEAGRKWALEHYTSEAIARRLLENLGISSFS